MNNHSTIKECAITHDSKQIKYFDLGNIPLVNNLCDTRDKAIDAERFPLNVNYYPASGLSSLNYAVDAELLFSHYLFKSEVNIPYIQHCKDMYDHIQKYIDVNSDTKFVDIGGNDGTLLHTFKNCTNIQLDVLNIDPSKNLAELSIEKGVPVLIEFFSAETVNKLNGSVADVVTSTNVFQHLKDINSFAEGVYSMLSDNGIWVLEFPYWMHDMETNQFDQIYHEHMYYHSVNPMNLMMNKHGLKIINVTKQTIHGGTLRLVIAKQDSKYVPDSTIEMYIQQEKKYDLNYHLNWGSRIQMHIENSKNLLLQLKEQGKTIYGFGAAAKGCIYLNAMNIDYNTIDCIIDDTDIKQGKYVPGTGIQVVSRDILKHQSPDYILILAHNFAEYIIQTLNLEYSGKFIILVPEIKIL